MSSNQPEAERIGRVSVVSLAAVMLIRARTRVIPMHRRTWVVKPRGCRWAVQRMDANNADSMHDTQASAIARGDGMAQRARGALNIKGNDGRVTEKRLFTGE